MKFLLAIGLFYGLPCTVTALEDWQNPDYILESFLEIALKNEYSTQKDQLKKWQLPIAFTMTYEYPDVQQYQHLVDKHLAHLQVITQHPIYPAKNKSSANVNIILTTENRWEKVHLPSFGRKAKSALRSSVCIGHMRLGTHNQIVAATVIIPVDKAIRHRKLVACVVEELTQIMGLPNDSEAVYPSIFNDKTPNDLLTGLDYLLLKLLYQPALKVNMDEKQIRKTAMPILLKWQTQKQITNAFQTVKKSGKLYRLMGYE